MDELALFNILDIFEHEYHVSVERPANPFYPCYRQNQLRLTVPYWYANNALTCCDSVKTQAHDFIAAVPPWLKLKYYLQFMCLITYNFQMRLHSGQ